MPKSWFPEFSWSVLNYPSLKFWSFWIFRGKKSDFFWRFGYWWQWGLTKMRVIGKERASSPVNSGEGNRGESWRFRISMILAGKFLRIAAQISCRRRRMSNGLRLFWVCFLSSFYCGNWESLYFSVRANAHYAFVQWFMAMGELGWLFSVSGCFVDGEISWYWWLGDW